jgi:Bifunctional DNA primase/polymerase, N-terminal
MSRVSDSDNSRNDAPPPLRAALARAAEGWAVHPLFGVVVRAGTLQCECRAGAGCKKPGKHPRLDAWGEQATRDPQHVSEMWRQFPRANIGGAAGHKSGRNVLDVDPRHGGDDSLAALERRHGALPETQETISGSGGKHLHFAHDGWSLGNTAGALGPGLDIRSDGGNVVLPGSLHVSGRVYEYEATHGPADVALAPTPEWLLTLLRAGPTGRRQPRPAPPPGPLVEGTVHFTFVSWIGAMHARGFSRGAIEAALLHENATRCNPVRPEAGLRRLIADVTARYEPGNVPAAHIIMLQSKHAEEAERARERRAAAFVLAKEAQHNLTGGKRS